MVFKRTPRNARRREIGGWAGRRDAVNFGRYNRYNGYWPRRDLLPAVAPASAVRETGVIDFGRMALPVHADAGMARNGLAERGGAMSAPRTIDVVLEQEFLPLRAKILELAAGLDRLDRASGDLRRDERRQRLVRAIRLLLEDAPTRAEQVQLLFSRDYDQAWRKQIGV